MTQEKHKTIITPWWIKNNAPWEGEIFDNMILNAESPGEQRVQRIRNQMIPYYKDGKRKLSINQALIITNAYQETEGVHPALRRAISIKKVFEEIPIDLLPEQLFMGTSSSGPNIVDFTPLYLPITPDEWENEKDLDTALQGAEDRYCFTKEDQKIFRDQIWTYWQSRSREIYFFNELSRNYPEAWHFMRFGQAARYSPLIGTGLAHSLQDYRSILEKGLLEVIADIQENISQLDITNPTHYQDHERKNIYESMIMVANGLIRYAERNAEFAEELAADETDHQRREELLEMGRICRKVPAHPAESWWEALQSFHFLHMATPMAESADAHSAGRFDQYILPYLEKEINSGQITYEKAQELLECFALKWNESRAFKLKLSVGNAGGGNNDKLNIGGMDENGNDCTNKLSYMLLEAHAHVHFIDPNLSVRLHRKTPGRFLNQVLEVIRLGGGLPILINDEAIVPALSSSCGVELEHARNYGDVGCQENLTDPNMTGADSNGRNNTGWINLVKPLELVIFNGFNKVKEVQVSPQTGDPRTFTTMDDFLQAVKTQINYAVKMNVVINNIYDYIYTKHFPCVYHDLMYPGPRRRGIDINDGGCRYNWTGSLCVGMANMGDIVTAIDHLIYQTKASSWDEILNALTNNWEGFEDLREKCKNAPKYGCDDEYADNWTKRILEMYYAAYEQYQTPRGGHFVMGLISMGNYVTIGRETWATPDGRKTGERLADSTSPSPYAPNYGPTASHNSVVRAVDPYHVPNGQTFNQRISASSINTARDINKWAYLVREFVDRQGISVQYNVIDSAILREAQEHPEAYRDLLVRVGGYSALFVELSREIQESIINRAELEL